MNRRTKLRHKVLQNRIRVHDGENSWTKKVLVLLGACVGTDVITTIVSRNVG